LEAGVVTPPVALIIEDDEVIANFFALAVQEAGFAPVVILDGQEALEKLDRESPDLVVLDMHLPHVTGVHILHAIRSSERLKLTKVLVISADAMLTEYVREEADLVLNKPVEFLQLRDMSARLKPSK
jgi:DNA-binding response OmpR family regulator